MKGMHTFEDRSEQWKISWVNGKRQSNNIKKEKKFTFAEKFGQ